MDLMCKYQGEDDLVIEIDLPDRPLLVYGDYPGWVTIDHLENGNFRNYTSITTILQRESDESYWILKWNRSMKSALFDDFSISRCIHRVQPIELRKTIIVTDWVQIVER